MDITWIRPSGSSTAAAERSGRRGLERLVDWCLAGAAAARTAPPEGSQTLSSDSTLAAAAAGLSPGSDAPPSKDARSGLSERFAWGKSCVTNLPA